MYKITIPNILSLNPCARVTQEYLEVIFNGREELSISETLDLNIINSNTPEIDILWVLCRPEFLPEEILEQLIPIYTTLISPDCKYYQQALSTTNVWEIVCIVFLANNLNREISIEMVNILKSLLA